MDLVQRIMDYWSLTDDRPIGQVESEIREELSFHIEMRTLENIEAGMTPEAARRDARRRFGDYERSYRDCRNILLGGRMMLQRAQFVLTIVMVAAVVYLGVALYRLDAKNQAVVEELSKAVQKLASLENAGATHSTRAAPRIGHRTWQAATVLPNGAVDTNDPDLDLAALTAVWEASPAPSLDAPWSRWDETVGDIASPPAEKP